MSGEDARGSSGERTGGVGWDRLREQDAAVRLLRTAVTDGTVPHALLLVGEPGLGQSQLVVSLVAALECERTGLAAGEARGVAGVLADEGCDECNTCRRVAEGTWTGRTEFSPAGAMHLVRQVRDEWVPAATRTGVEGRRRVLRVLRADRMNETTQNAFLKVLEEPPPAVVWVLDAEDPSRLLDTIRSRVRRIDMSPWSPTALAEWASSNGVQLPEEQQAGLLRAAAGAPERLRELADEPRRATRDLALDTLRTLVEDGPARVDALAREVVGHGKAYEKRMQAVHETEAAGIHARWGVERDADLPKGLLSGRKEQWKRVERAERAKPVAAYLDDLGSWLRDLVVVVGAGGDVDAVAAGIVNRDRLPELTRDAGWFAVPDLLEGIAAIERCRDALHRNGVAELQLDRVLLTLAGPAFLASR